MAVEVGGCSAQKKNGREQNQAEKKRLGRDSFRNLREKRLMMINGGHRFRACRLCCGLQVGHAVHETLGEEKVCEMEDTVEEPGETREKVGGRVCVVFCW